MFIDVIFKTVYPKILKSLSKISYILLGIILTILVGNVFPTFFSEITKIFTHRILSSKTVSYQRLSISSYKKYELIKWAEMENLGPFNFRLDDPILTDYCLIKALIRNEGEAIDSKIKLSASTALPHSKFLDVKYKIIKPANKQIKIIHSIPDLTWIFPDSKYSMKFSWEYPDLDHVAGFNIYQSLLNDVGYGRMNDKLITHNEYESSIDSVKLSSTVYCKVNAVSLNGVEGDLSSSSIKFPDVLAFADSFKDVYWVDPSLKATYKVDGSSRAPFHSLSEAVRQTKTTGIFIFKQNREDILKTENVSNEVKVLYKEDLAFLNDNLDVTFFDGLDKDSHIELYFLLKIMPEKPFDLNMKLHGAPGITFKRYGEMTNLSLVDKKEVKDEPKKLLTPTEVISLLGKNTIYLMWKKPDTPLYKGVRIFRSGRRVLGDLSNIGEEIYDGPGNTGIIECPNFIRLPIKPNENLDELKFRTGPENYEPPPKRDQRNLALSPPRNLRLEGSRTYENKGEYLYFADKTAAPGKSYTYTVYAYIDPIKYSYPILINSSLSDWTAEGGCHIKQTISSAGRGVGNRVGGK